MKEKKEKRKLNIPRIIWITGLYIALIMIFILVVIFKVKYQG